MSDYRGWETEEDCDLAGTMVPELEKKVLFIRVLYKRRHALFKNVSMDADLPFLRTGKQVSTEKRSVLASLSFLRAELLRNGTLTLKNLSEQAHFKMVCFILEMRIARLPFVLDGNEEYLWFLHNYSLNY